MLLWVSMEQQGQRDQVSGEALGFTARVQSLSVELVSDIMDINSTPPVGMTDKWLLTD